MLQIKTIITSLACREYSQGIFEYAASMATAFHADLIAAHVINERDIEAVRTIVTMGYNVDGEHYIQNIKKERREIIDRIIANSGFPQEKTRVLIGAGNPINEMLKFILNEKADMVVMGPKGRTDLEHVLVGSVASKLFKRSPVTVVSYRGEADAARLKKHIHL